VPGVPGQQLVLCREDGARALPVQRRLRAAGELCVACPVGKARQANHNNSIVCETCQAETFTSVSTSITCGACSPDCPDLTFPAINLARTCSAGGCPLTNFLSVDSSAYGGFRVVDGITTIQNLGFISHITERPWLMIDFEKTVYVWMVRLYNRPDCCQDRLTNFEIRVGSSRRRAGCQ
jgi:hypothetical protein